MEALHTRKSDMNGWLTLAIAYEQLGQLQNSQEAWKNLIEIGEQILQSTLIMALHYRTCQ